MAMCVFVSNKSTESVKHFQWRIRDFTRDAKPNGGSKGSARDACPPGVQILSFSCSFRQKKLKNKSTFGSWRNPLRKILDPPLGCANIILRHMFLKLHEIKKIGRGASKFVYVDLDPTLILNQKCFRTTSMV